MLEFGVDNKIISHDRGVPNINIKRKKARKANKRASAQRKKRQ